MPSFVITVNKDNRIYPPILDTDTMRQSLVSPCNIYLFASLSEQVTAKGSPDVALSWIFDLQLGMARLFGQLCSASLDSRKASPTLSNGDSEEETKLLHSEIWTTLFRGGYMTGKLQRSLSGHHVSNFYSRFLVMFK